MRDRSSNSSGGGHCRWARGSRKANGFCQLLISGVSNATRARLRVRARAKQRPAVSRAGPARLLDLDLSFHRRVQAADVIEEPCLIELDGGALPAEQYAGLAPRDRDLVR